MTETKDTYTMRFGRALAAMENPVKDTDAHKYKYATLDQVQGIVKPALFEQGLVLLQTVVYEDGSHFLVTSVIDTITGETHTYDTRLVYIGQNAQTNGSFETYSRRYALLTVFGLAPEDDDGAATAKGRKPRAEKPASSPVEVAKGRLWHDVTVHAEKAGIDAKDEYRRLMVQAQNMQGCSNMDDLTADTITTVCELYEREVFNV